MKKILVLAILALAAWQAWKRYPQLFERSPQHQAVIRNRGDRTMERVRLIVDRQTFVREVLDPGAEAMFPFEVARDGGFELHWVPAGAPGEASWRGGQVARGPLVQRHEIAVRGPGSVVYTATPLPAR